MYHAYWGLSRAPFGKAGDGDYYLHQTPAVEEALARLQFLVEQQRRLGLIIAPAGGGKSMLLRTLARQWRAAGWAVAAANLTAIAAEELAWQVAAQLGGNPDPDAAPYALWRLVTDLLAESRYLRRPSVVLLDDADQADNDVLGCIARLVHLDTAEAARLTVVLTAQPPSLQQIGDDLLDHVDLRVDLEPWTAEDTTQFVTTAVQWAGATRPAFQPDASSRLHELSGGVPRKVAHIADLALLAGAGQSLPQVDRATVESVYQELVQH